MNSSKPSSDFEVELYRQRISHAQSTHSSVTSKSAAIGFLLLKKTYPEDLRAENLNRSLAKCFREMKAWIKRLHFIETEKILESKTEAKIEVALALSKREERRASIEFLKKITEESFDPELDRVWVYLSEIKETLAVDMPLKEVLVLTWIASNDHQKYAHHYQGSFEAAKAGCASRIESFFSQVQIMRQHTLCHTANRHDLLFSLNQSYDNLSFIEDERMFILMQVREYLDLCLGPILEEKRPAPDLHLKIAIWLEKRDASPLLQALDQTQNTFQILQNTLIHHGVAPNDPHLERMFQEVLPHVSCVSKNPLLQAVSNIFQASPSKEVVIQTALLKLQSDCRSANYFEITSTPLEHFMLAMNISQAWLKHENALTITSLMTAEMQEIPRLLDQYYEDLSHQGIQHCLDETLKSRLDAYQQVLKILQNRMMVDVIENFFVQWFIAQKETPVDSYTLYRLISLLIDTSTQRKIRLKDEDILKYLDSDNNRENGRLWINVYWINRLFLNAIMTSQSEWSTLFETTLDRVIDFVEKDFHSEMAGIGLILKADSYPERLLNQLKDLKAGKCSSTDSRENAWPILHPNHVDTAAIWCYLIQDIGGVNPKLNPYFIEKEKILIPSLIEQFKATKNLYQQSSYFYFLNLVFNDYYLQVLSALDADTDDMMFYAMHWTDESLHFLEKLMIQPQVLLHYQKTYKGYILSEIAEKHALQSADSSNLRQADKWLLLSKSLRPEGEKTLLSYLDSFSQNLPDLEVLCKGPRALLKADPWTKVFISQEKEMQVFISRLKGRDQIFLRYVLQQIEIESLLLIEPQNLWQKIMEQSRSRREEEVKRLMNPKLWIYLKSFDQGQVTEWNMYYLNWAFLYAVFIPKGFWGQGFEASLIQALRSDLASHIRQSNTWRAKTLALVESLITGFTEEKSPESGFLLPHLARTGADWMRLTMSMHQSFLTEIYTYGHWDVIAKVAAFVREDFQGEMLSSETLFMFIYDVYRARKLSSFIRELHYYQIEKILIEITASEKIQSLLYRRAPQIFYQILSDEIIQNRLRASLVVSKLLVNKIYLLQKKSIGQDWNRRKILGWTEILCKIQPREGRDLVKYAEFLFEKTSDPCFRLVYLKKAFYAYIFPELVSTLIQTIEGRPAYQNERMLYLQALFISALFQVMDQPPEQFVMQSQCFIDKMQKLAEDNQASPILLVAQLYKNVLCSSELPESEDLRRILLSLPNEASRWLFIRFLHEKYKIERFSDYQVLFAVMWTSIGSRISLVGNLFCPDFLRGKYFTSDEVDILVNSFPKTQEGMLIDYLSDHADMKSFYLKRKDYLRLQRDYPMSIEAKAIAMPQSSGFFAEPKISLIQWQSTNRCLPDGSLILIEEENGCIKRMAIQNQHSLQLQILRLKPMKKIRDVYRDRADNLYVLAEPQREDPFEALSTYPLVLFKLEGQTGRLENYFSIRTQAILRIDETLLQEYGIENKAKFFKKQ